MGFVVEVYGIGVLFGDFLYTIAGYVGGVPVVGPWVRWVVERVRARRGSELPV